MNFEFSGEQQLMRESSCKFLQNNCSLPQTRAALEKPQPVNRDLWKQICDLGWVGVAIPEEFGGAGLGALEQCVLAEELGRAVSILPFSSTVYFASEALLMAGSEAQKVQYLPRIASGSAIATLAVAEGEGALSKSAIAAQVQSGVLSGEKNPVADGLSADIAIVAALEEGEVTLFLVELDAGHVKRQFVKTIDDSRPYAKLRFNGAPAERLGPPGGGWDILMRLYDRAAVLLAFEQIGGAQAALDAACAYAKDRVTFGRPIGSYQAIKHRLADMYVSLELARSNAYYGAWALEKDSPNLPVAAAGARISASEAYSFCAAENLQIHGGVGFTWEYDCHLHYRRSKALQLQIGSPLVWKRKLVDRLQRKNA